MRQGDAREAWVALRGWQYIQGLKRVRTNLHRRLQLVAGIDLLCQFVRILLHPFIYSVFDDENQIRWRLGGLTVPLLHVPHLKLKDNRRCCDPQKRHSHVLSQYACYHASALLWKRFVFIGQVCGMWNLTRAHCPLWTMF